MTKKQKFKNYKIQQQNQFKLKKNKKLRKKLSKKLRKRKLRKKKAFLIIQRFLVRFMIFLQAIKLIRRILIWFML